MTDETTTQQPTETPTPNGLTVNDLTLTLQVIQVATSRGAFKADELSAIGGLYDRVFKFLEASGAIQKAPDTASNTTATEKAE